jgi:hypothetical protein
MAKYPYISEKSCKNCNGPILVKRNRDVKNEFCGSACVGKFLHTKEKELTNCNFCKKEFTKTSRTKNLFCSKQCANSSRIVEHKRTCERCGKNFVCHNIADINRGKAKFCSVSCSTRKYSFDENYFNNIDTPNKAYILGFLYSDGCVSKKETEMIIKLHNKDKNILEKIKVEMKSEHPIKSIIQPNRDEQVRFSISSIDLCKKLISHGVVPAKTFIIEFPNLKNELVRHFIRGYFDGDGCISKIKNKNSYRITIFTASKNFMLSLTNVMTQNNINTSVYNRNNGFAICFGKQESIDNFYNFIYTDAEIYLERKKNKFNN